MNNPQPSLVSYVLSHKTLEDLYRLWRQTATNKEGFILITSDDVPTLTPLNGVGQLGECPENGSERFALLLKADWSILLLTHSLQAQFTSGEEPSPFYQVTITWETETVNNFIRQKNLKVTNLPQDKSNSATEREFLLNLLNLLNSDRQEDVSRPILPFGQKNHTALDQRVTQEKVLHQVISHIRQSLDLAEILDTTVQEVRDFLQVDRLVIFQFNPDNSPESNNYSSGWGKVTYESTASKKITPLLKLISDDECFTYIPQHQEKFHQGIIVTVNNVDQRYSHSFCLLETLHKYDIRAKMIAPIVVRGNLWGLLIAHQCSQPRDWLPIEKTFLGHIGEHLSVAIDQAQLYAEVQKQKNNFEQRIIERTKELKDTILASQAASRSKNAFLDSVSHELRTPLTCVIGLSGTLLHWSSAASSLPLEKQHQYLKTIQKSGKQLLELINEILELSQLEAGNSLLNIREFSLKKSTNLVLQTLQEEARNAQINVECQFRIDKEQDLFWGDVERIQQILFHLLSNAIKFTPPKGKVIVRIWREQQKAVFQIEDTGIGIPEIHLPRLFERFEQLEKFREKVYPGTGLGLALTKQLVDLNNGRIEVESVLETGSIFTVWIPDNRETQNKIPVNKTSQPNISFNKTIILIERDEEIATLICELLTAAEYQVVWLIDSATAIRKIELLQPKLVMVDKQLSEVHNISQNLRRLKTTQNIKILLLSNQISANEQNEIDDYLLKPIQPNLLLQRISSLINYDL